MQRHLVIASRVRTHKIQMQRFALECGFLF